MSEANWIPQMSQIFRNLRRSLKSWCGQSTWLWTLPAGDDMPLSMMRWILLGHGWWQLTPVILEHLLTSQPTVHSVEITVHSCTSPWHERILTDVVSCLCEFRVDRRILAKCGLQMPLIARWIRKGNSSRTRTEDQQIETAGPTWNGFCTEHRQTVSTQSIQACRRTHTCTHQEHQTWIQSKSLVMSVHGDHCLSTGRGDNLLAWLPWDSKPTLLHWSHDWQGPQGIVVWGRLVVKAEPQGEGSVPWDCHLWDLKPSISWRH